MVGALRQLDIQRFDYELVADSLQCSLDGIKAIIKIEINAFDFGDCSDDLNKTVLGSVLDDEIQECLNVRVVV